MELRLLGTKGIPDGSIISVKVGTVRRQAILGSGRSYRFTSVSSGKQQMKVDVYAPVAHARLLIEPAEALVPVALDAGPAPNVGGVAWEKPRQDMALEFQIAKPGGCSMSGLGLESERDCDSAQAVPISRPSSAQSNRSASRRHQVALEAQPYFEQHHLMEVMQTLLQAVIKEKPGDPYAYMIRVLQNSSMAVAGRKRLERPQSAQARLSSAAPQPLRSSLRRPSSAPKQRRSVSVQEQPATVFPTRSVAASEVSSALESPVGELVSVPEARKSKQAQASEALQPRDTWQPPRPAQTVPLERLADTSEVVAAEAPRPCQMVAVHRPADPSEVVAVAEAAGRELQRPKSTNRELEIANQLKKQSLSPRSPMSPISSVVSEIWDPNKVSANMDSTPPARVSGPEPSTSLLAPARSTAQQAAHSTVTSTEVLCAPPDADTAQLPGKTPSSAAPTVHEDDDSSDSDDAGDNSKTEEPSSSSRPRRSVLWNPIRCDSSPSRSRHPFYSPLLRSHEELRWLVHEAMLQKAETGELERILQTSLLDGSEAQLATSAKPAPPESQPAVAEIASTAPQEPPTLVQPAACATPSSCAPSPPPAPLQSLPPASSALPAMLASPQPAPPALVEGYPSAPAASPPVLDISGDATSAEAAPSPKQGLSSREGLEALRVTLQQRISGALMDNTLEDVLRHATSEPGALATQAREAVAAPAAHVAPHAPAAAPNAVAAAMSVTAATAAAPSALGAPLEPATASDAVAAPVAPTAPLPLDASLPGATMPGVTLPAANLPVAALPAAALPGAGGSLPDGCSLLAAPLAHATAPAAVAAPVAARAAPTPPVAPAAPPLPVGVQAATLTTEAAPSALFQPTRGAQHAAAAAAPAAAAALQPPTPVDPLAVLMAPRAPLAPIAQAAPLVVATPADRRMDMTLEVEALRGEMAEQRRKYQQLEELVQSLIPTKR